MQPEAGVLLCRLNVQVQMSTDSLLSEQEFLWKCYHQLLNPSTFPLQWRLGFSCPHNCFYLPLLDSALWQQEWRLVGWRSVSGPSFCITNPKALDGSTGWRVICVPDLLSGRNNGSMSIAYIAIAKGSPCVLPTLVGMVSLQWRGRDMVCRCSPGQRQMQSRSSACSPRWLWGKIIMHQLKAHPTQV